MIRQIQLKHFRQHQHYAIDFTHGTTVIYGANESGKSTLFEAITFALFGVRACRNNDLSSWGVESNSHQVMLHFTVENIDYTLKRSARSAEITWATGRVTGQTDVSRFCENLWQLKPNTGSKLMFIGQNSIRGILEEGGVKTAQMIEQLADFDQIEHWIHTLQTEFTTGSVEPYQQNLSYLNQQLNELQTELAALPDPEQQAAQLRQQLHAQQNEYQTQQQHYQQQLAQLTQEWQHAQTLNQQQQHLQRQLDQVEAHLAATERLLDAPLLSVDPQSVQQAEQQLHDLQAQYQLWQDYCLAKDYQTHPHRLALTADELQQQIEQRQHHIQHLQTQHASLTGEIKSLQNHLHTDLYCSQCHRAWDNIEQMQQANQITQQQITQLQNQQAHYQQQLQQQQQELTQRLELFHYPVPVLPPHSHWQIINDAHYPPCLQWTTTIPTEITPTMLQQAQQKWQHAQREWQRAQDQQAHFQAAQQRHQTLLNEVAHYRAQLNQLPPIAAAADIRLAINNLEHQAQAITQQLQQVQHSLAHFDDLTQPWFTQHQKITHKINQLQQHIQTTQHDIHHINLNNQLLKALRSIKPKIANQIWQTVCSTISHYFSLMRQQTSVVSKGENGFMVDGKDVYSLSGSTLDILGLAIRVALTKTFLPHCHFLLLDEPFAACDAQRQAQALGFIHTLGFDQIIIVTHDNLTEAVADHVIEL